MAIASKVRQIYEERPYPRINQRALRGMRWKLAPMEWIDAVWQPAQPAPGKILVAGCGTGAEAFALSRRFPRSRIVAADFSPRSIAVARDSQTRASGMQNIRFLVADLTNPKFVRAVGGSFDFISCHGVLSYVPDAENVMKTLAGCLAAEGALYIGVNGGAHPSAPWRKVLSGFGFEMETFRDGGKLRKILALLDSLLGVGSFHIARQDSGYLAGDLFGPPMLNLPLADWVQMGRNAGLHFRGNHTSHDLLRPAINNGSSRDYSCRVLAPVEVCRGLLDVLIPLPFHRAVFARQMEKTPPWEEPAKLLAWRPRVAIEAFRRDRWPEAP